MRRVPRILARWSFALLAGCATAPPGGSTAAWIPVGEIEAWPPRLAAYRVRRGDTWYGIARRTGLNLEELARLNGRRPEDGLHAGEEILIPDRRPNVRNVIMGDPGRRGP